MGDMRQNSRGESLEELYRAVLLLASEPGGVEERLALAYFQYIRPVDVAEFPPHAQLRLESIRARLRQLYPAQGRVEDVDRDAAATLAVEITLLYDDLNH